MAGGKVANYFSNLTKLARTAAALPATMGCGQSLDLGAGVSVRAQRVIAKLP